MSMNRDTRSASAGSALNTGGATGRSTLVGVFDDRRRAQEAVAELERLGFSADQVGYAARDGDTAAMGGRDAEVTTDTGSGSGALTGAATGGLLGGIIGAAAALLLPGIGPVVAAGILGPLVGAAAAGAGIGAAGGGLIGGLTTTGVAEEDAHYYDEQFRAGRSLVVVNAAGREAEARRVLEQFGAYDVDRRQAADYDYSGRTGTAARTGEQLRGEGTVRIPEVEERLDVEKRERQAGEVRIDKRVEEERKTIPVELEREEVHVERRDVNRPLTDADRAAFEEGTIRVPVRAEEAVVRKEAVVTGEVVVDKERHTEREQVSDTVRRTHVEVDKDLDRSRTGATTAAAWSDAMPRYRTQWQQRHASRGGRWEEFEPAYRYGYEMRSDPRFAGRPYAEVEPELRAEWGRRNPGSAWDRFKSNVREAWEDAKD